MLLNILFFKVGHVEIAENRVQNESHRYTVSLNVIITKVVVK